MQGFHAIIAMRRSEPHWLLSDADAQVYGQALQKAIRHLPVYAAQSSIDFTALAIVAFNMETPRIYRSRMNARGQRPPQPMGQVFQFRPPPPQGPASPVPPSPPPPAAPPNGEAVEGFQEDGVDAPIGGV